MELVTRPARGSSPEEAEPHNNWHGRVPVYGILQSQGARPSLAFSRDISSGEESM